MGQKNNNISGINSINSSQQNKIPSYVPIYNLLCDDIIKGIYKKGTSLPGETTLAAKYGVSRNTLRQALTVLTQDGYIYKKQGKGTIVSYDKHSFSDKEKFYNFLVECAKEEITDVKMNYNIGPPTKIAQNKLRLEDGENVLASNNFYISDEAVIGHSFIQIPTEYYEARNINIEKENELYKLINYRIYKDTNKADIKLQCIKTDEQLMECFNLEEAVCLLFIEQILYGVDGYPIARIKYYFLNDKYQVACQM